MSSELLVKKNDLGNIPFGRLPIASNFARRFASYLDQEARQKSIETVLSDLITGQGGQIEKTYQNQATESALSSGGSLVIGEHPRLFDDVFPLVASLPERPIDDTFLIALVDNVGLGPYIEKHIIPVYINNRPNKDSFVRRVWHRYGYNPPIFFEDEAKRKNDEGMKYASTLIEMGKRVVIFPDGVHRNNRWSAGGVGKIIAGLDKGDDACVVFVYVNGESRSLISLMPGVNFFTKYKAQVNFMGPLYITQLLQEYNHDQIAITQALQNMYDQMKQPYY